MTSTNPTLLSAANNARGLLAVILATTSVNEKRFTADQLDLMEEVLVELRAASLLPSCDAGWLWNTMEHPDIEKIKAEGTRVLMFIPRKLFRPNPAKPDKTQLIDARLVMARWAHVVEPTKAVTSGKLAHELEHRHGGFWSIDYRGIKPIKGSPSLWAYLPDIGDTLIKSSRQKPEPEA